MIHCPRNQLMIIHQIFLGYKTLLHIWFKFFLITIDKSDLFSWHKKSLWRFDIFSCFRCIRFRIIFWFPINIDYLKLNLLRRFNFKILFSWLCNLFSIVCSLIFHSFIHCFFYFISHTIRGWFATFNQRLLSLFTLLTRKNLLAIIRF